MPLTRHIGAVLVCLSLLGLSALGCETSTTPTPQATPLDQGRTPSDLGDMGTSSQDLPEGSVTYQNTVRAIFEQRCVSCHTQGGVAPFSMTYDAQEWSQSSPWWAMASVNAVASGSMPPWMPSEQCRPLHGSRALPSQERELIAQWGKLGAPAGKPSDYLPAPQPLEPDPLAEVGEPSLSLSAPEPYMPSATRADDYRCFVLDASFDVETYVRGVHVREDKRAIVHHAIVYLIPPADVDETLKRDNGEDGPGYTCYGGPGSSAARNIGGWVPGSQPSFLPEGLAHVVPAGSKLVLQMHYNTLNVPQDQRAPADQTEVDIWTLPAGQRPTQEVRVVPLANLFIDIPAGDVSSSHERDYRVPSDVTLIGTTPHMHTLGASIGLDLINEQTQEKTCLIDIPRWDFNWQQSYSFAQGHSLELKRGDVLRQRCTYDNSPENQQVINGQQRAPKRVFWGDGTLDEMCLIYAIITRPYVADEGMDCSLNQRCLTECATDDAECFMRCAFYTTGECASCGVDKYFSCPTRDNQACITQGVALQTCSNGCVTTEMTCLQLECREELDAYTACANPYFKSGTCDVSDCAK